MRFSDFCDVIDLFHTATDPHDFERARLAAEDLTSEEQLSLVPSIIEAGRRCGVYAK